MNIGCMQTIKEKIIYNVKGQVFNVQIFLRKQENKKQSIGLLESNYQEEKYLVPEKNVGKGRAGSINIGGCRKHGNRSG